MGRTGASLVYSTFLGGSGFDVAISIAVDENGSAYMTGHTTQSDFPTTAGAFDTTFNGGGSDAFATKVNPAGTSLVYSTFLGGSGSEIGGSLLAGGGIAVDGAGFAYVTGSTGSSDFPTTAGAFDTTFNEGGRDVFVTKVDPAGAALAYSSYLGSSNHDEGFGIAVDGAGFAYVTGNALSSDFPTTAGAFDTTHNGSTDAFVPKLALTPAADLAVTDLSSSFSLTPACSGPGRNPNCPKHNVDLEATIANIGGIAASNVQVQFAFRTDGGGSFTIIGGPLNVGTIAPSGMAPAGQAWMNISTGIYDIRVTVDPGNLIDESDELNNVSDFAVNVP